MKKLLLQKENNNNPNIVKCFCGNEIQVDWSKIPNTEKVIYLKCPKCGSELKRENPFTLENINLNGITSNTTNEQLIEELSNYIKNNSGINILEDWYSCKNTNPQFKEFLPKVIPSINEIKFFYKHNK